MTDSLRVLDLSLEIVRLDKGHWCRTCRAGSAVRADVALTDHAGDRMQLLTRWQCWQCGGHDVQAVD